MPRTIRTALSLLAILAAAALTQSRAATEKTLDPLVVDPQHYHLYFENQYVQVTREHMGPHGSMPMHQHLPPGALIVFITARENRLTNADGKSDITRNKPGDIQWAGPAIHRSENLMNADFEAVRIQPKEPPAGAAPKPAPAEKMDPVVTDPQHYKVEFENQYVRAIRVKIGPHEKLKMHRHPDTGAVIVLLTDQDMRQQHPDGKTTENHAKAGTSRWAPPDAGHIDENIGDKPVELIRVELKMARP